MLLTAVKTGEFSKIQEVQKNRQIILFSHQFYLFSHKFFPPTKLILPRILFSSEFYFLWKILLSRKFTTPTYSVHQVISPLYICQSIIENPTARTSCICTGKKFKRCDTDTRLYKHEHILFLLFCSIKTLFKKLLRFSKVTILCTIKPSHVFSSTNRYHMLQHSKTPRHVKNVTSDIHTVQNWHISVSSKD